MDRYLGGEEIALTSWSPTWRRPSRAGRSTRWWRPPPRPGSGLAELLEVLTRAFPSPLERALPAVTDLDGSPAPDR